MRVLAVHSIKGGVGKTAAAVNFAFAAARRGRRTLVWDLDPQGAASFYFRVKPKLKGGTERMLARKDGLDRVVKGTDFDDLDVIPADFAHRNMDILLDGFKKRTRRLARLLEPLAEDYDLAVLDCPPGVSLLSENVFEASDALAVPIVPTTLSLRTYAQLVEHAAGLGAERPALVPFFSMVDRRKRMHKALMVEFARAHAECVRAYIPHATEVERMGETRMPVGAFAPSSRGAAAFEAAWDEIEPRLDGAALVT